jgi:hypothetical protein
VNPVADARGKSVRSSWLVADALELETRARHCPDHPQVACDRLLERDELERLAIKPVVVAFTIASRETTTLASRASRSTSARTALATWSITSPGHLRPRASAIPTGLVDDLRRVTSTGSPGGSRWPARPASAGPA